MYYNKHCYREVAIPHVFTAQNVPRVTVTAGEEKVFTPVTLAGKSPQASLLVQPSSSSHKDDSSSHCGANGGRE